MMSVTLRFKSFSRHEAVLFGETCFSYGSDARRSLRQH